MFLSRPPTAGAHHDGAGEYIPLYEPDELDALREELLEAYSTDRTKLHTRDEVIQQRKTEFALKELERQKVVKKKDRDDATTLELKAKQAALARLYENVIEEKERKRKRRPKKESSVSTASFHQMYTVYHDPMSGNIKAVRGSTGEEGNIAVTDENETVAPVKVLNVKAPPPPSKASRGSDKLSQGKERSKFVLKKQLSSLQSKPPALLEGTKRRTSKDMRSRYDTRYSYTKDRFSFDVDVAGPFFNLMDPNNRPKVRNVATQVMMVDGVTPTSETGSQVDVGSWNSGKRYSRSTDRKSQNSEDLYDEDSYEWDGDGAEEDEDQAGGDASSSNPSESQDELHELRDEDVEKGKTLERKESKRREAETMARPRGYRNLELREPIAYVTFEAETYVTAHDLDKDEAKRRGLTTFTRENILWPTYSEFDMDTAAKKIEDYIKRCWTLDPKWLFVIQPLEVYHDSYRKKYIFEVRFSIPSPTTPVPPATASVFFVFEIPIYIMKDEEVKVTYVLEGTRFPHNPGKIPFQDKWLWGIITDKLRIQKVMNF